MVSKILQMKHHQENKSPVYTKYNKMGQSLPRCLLLGLMCKRCPAVERINQRLAAKQTPRNRSAQQLAQQQAQAQSGMGG